MFVQNPDEYIVKNQTNRSVVPCLCNKIMPVRVQPMTEMESGIEDHKKRLRMESKMTDKTSKKRNLTGFKTRLLAMIMAVVLTGCTGGQKDAKQTSVTTEAVQTAVSSTSDEQIVEIIAGMSTEQKLAQMMIIALRSDADNSSTPTELTPEYENLIAKYDFGGIILFTGNIENTKQTVTLTRACQAAALSSDKGIPMFMCVDQEGGLVNRVSFGTTSSGSMGLAATGDTALTEESAAILGQEIKALGFNMDFAPVSDVNNNPANPIIGTRSFSDDPETAGSHVKAFVNGLKKSGVLSALKHFPGHGNVGEDSHTHLPSSELTVDELKSCELIPFEEGVASGADMIMTAHIQFPNIEKETYISKEDGKEVYLPATLSKTIMTGLLRDDLGYDGVIITDSMVMDAIAAHFDETDAGVMAINAGVDILLCPVDIYKDSKIDTIPDMDEYMNKLVARVEAGDIKEEELDDSVARILKLKMESGIMTDTLNDTLDNQVAEAELLVGSGVHHKREWEIMQKGITLLKNEGDMLPLSSDDCDKTLILISNEYRQPAVEYALSRLKKENVIDNENVAFMCYNDLEPDDKGIKEAVDKADKVLIISQSVAKQELLSNVIDQVHQREGAKVALLSVGLPYDTACYEDADAVLCAYNQYGDAYDEEGNGPFNLNVAVAVCTAFGLSTPQGSLPVNIPKVVTNASNETEYSEELLYERGYGLKNWGK